jgi:hypothetical protein
MLSTSKTLLLFEPSGSQYLTQVHQIKTLFQREEWYVEKLQPYTKIYNPNAVILIPDTAGLNVNMEYVKTKFPPIFPPQDPGLEYFRLNFLHYYVKKKMPILGIGTSSFLIFAEVCKGNLIFGADGLSWGATKLPNVDTNTNNFVGPYCGGLLNFSINEDLCEFAEALLPRPDGGEEVEPALVLV